MNREAQLMNAESTLFLLLFSCSSCPALCDPMDYSLSGSSVHGISEARIRNRLPFLTPEDLPGPGIKPASPALQMDSLSLSLQGSLSIKIERMK